MRAGLEGEQLAIALSGIKPLGETEAAAGEDSGSARDQKVGFLLWLSNIHLCMHTYVGLLFDRSSSDNVNRQGVLLDKTLCTIACDVCCPAAGAQDRNPSETEVALLLLLCRPPHQQVHHPSASAAAAAAAVTATATQQQNSQLASLHRQNSSSRPAAVASVRQNWWQLYWQQQRRRLWQPVRWQF
jgi:hypothetical protein